jgi:hypothetical protein
MVRLWNWVGVFVRCRFEFIGCGEELLVFEFELKAGE